MHCTDYPADHATGERRRCWRDKCRQIFGDYRTLAILRHGQVVAFCHDQIVDANDPMYPALAVVLDLPPGRLPAAA